MAMFNRKHRDTDPASIPGGPQQADPTRAIPLRQSSIGAKLLETRQELGWELADIGAALRIKPDYLAALERNSLNGLPGLAYAMGFLRAYADYLGLDGLDAVRRFKIEQAGLDTKPELTFPMPLTERSVPGTGFALVALILVTLCYGTYYYINSGHGSARQIVDAVPAHLMDPPTIDPPVLIAESPSEPPKPIDTAAPTAPSTAAPAIAAIGTAQTNPPGPASKQPAGATPLAGVTNPAVPPSQTPPPTPAPTIQTPTIQAQATVPTQGAAPAPKQVFGAPQPGRIVVRAVADSWVDVRDKKQSVLTRVLKAGDVYNAPASDTLTLRTGNAGGIQIEVDGKSLGNLGSIGQVKQIALDPSKLAP